MADYEDEMDIEPNNADMNNTELPSSSTQAVVGRKRFEVKKWSAVGALGLGYRGGQLRHLPQPHNGSVHRVSGQPSERHQRGVHCGLGRLQPCLPLPLYLPMAQNQTSLSSGQPRVGVPEVWPLEAWHHLSLQIVFSLFQTCIQFK